MNIKINDKYSITSDKHNFILQERKIVKSGENKGQERFIDVGFYGNINQLLSRLAQQELRDSDINTLQGVLKHLYSFNKELQDISDRIEGVVIQNGKM